MLIQSLILIMLALLVPVTSHATVIKQQPYRFSFEAAAAREDEHFVVCGTCPDHLLTLLPVVPKLAVRLTAPEHPAVPTDQVVPEVEPQEGDALHPTERTATVLFAFDSAHLSWSERAKLSLLVKELPATGTFDLTGYTCTIGTDAYNERLSLRRAQQVASLLQADGLKIGRVEGKGRCCPVSSDKRLNRRVEIREHERGSHEREK